MHKPVFLILLPVIRNNFLPISVHVERNFLYFIWYRFKIIICPNFNLRNSNAEISLETGMIPQKLEWLASLLECHQKYSDSV